jgi:hypothetical protein
MPVAQDVLEYTPSGAKSTLKLPVATDVRAEPTQTEASRQMVSIGSWQYDEVIVNGKLSVKNYKSKMIRINVRKSLLGEVSVAGQDGKITKVVKQLAAANPNSEIEWEFNLDPGKENVLTYTYKVLIRR